MGQNTFTAIDLYSGSGAVTEGLKTEGFKVLAAVDSDPISCKTYELNHPGVHLFQEDIRYLSPALLRKTARIKGRVDLLVVCAPCQPFSSQNRRRVANDPRASLILESIKFVKEFKPLVVFFENVPGIAASELLTALRQGMAECGYFLGEPRTIDASYCGVAQRRERCIMVASRKAAIISNFYDTIKKRPRITVREVIGHLPALSAGERDVIDLLHFARRHQPIVLKRLRQIPKDGGSRSALPPALELRCHKGRTNDFPDVYGRMKWDDVAPTLTTGCTDVTKGRYAHPRDDRAITLREAALLQSFPPNYRFYGNAGQIATQIGNAVPVNMIKTLAFSLIECVNALRNAKGKCYKVRRIGTPAL